MEIDFETAFKAYEALRQTADDAFKRIRSEFPECVNCGTGCVDCCYALFDIPPIEAIYLQHHFKQTLDEPMQAELIEKANRADRSVYRIKRKAYKAAAQGTSEKEILFDITSQRIRCPLLNAENRCDLYPYRPITCRLYGIPTASNGVSHTCGLSGFRPGKPYPTVYIDRFYQKLYELSVKLIAEIGSRHVKMADMLIPVSMALLTEFDEAGLDVGEEKKEGA